MPSVLKTLDLLLQRHSIPIELKELIIWFLWRNHIHDINLELTDPKLHTQIHHRSDQFSDSRLWGPTSRPETRRSRKRFKTHMNYGRLMIRIISPSPFKKFRGKHLGITDQLNYQRWGSLANITEIASLTFTHRAAGHLGNLSGSDYYLHYLTPATEIESSGSDYYIRYRRWLLSYDDYDPREEVVTEILHVNRHPNVVWSHGDFSRKRGETLTQNYLYGFSLKELLGIFLKIPDVEED
jgi:hypothetical protein